MTGVPGVDRPATAAQEWDATAEAKGRPTVAQLADPILAAAGLLAPEDGIARAKTWADERRAEIARRAPRTDREHALDFIVGLCSLHLPAERVTDETKWAGCMCKDGAHEWPGSEVSEASARRVVAESDDCHLVTVRRIVIDVPPVEVP